MKAKMNFLKNNYLSITNCIQLLKIQQMQFKTRILGNMKEKSIMENLMVKEHTLVLMDKDILVNGS